MKKILKETIIALCIIISICLLTGCNKQTEKKEKEVEETAKGNCKILECIKQLEITSSLEDINNIIGFEGEKTKEGEGYTIYTWKLKSDEEVEATFYSTSTTIRINFNDDLIYNEKVDFSKYDEIKTSLNNKEAVSYDEIKEKFGKVEGTLVEKNSYGNKYKWVGNDGAYLVVSFSTDNKKCTMVSGQI